MPLSFNTCFLLLNFIILQLSEAIISSNNNSNATRYFDLDRERLRELWHVTGIRTLIKARARSLLPCVPKVDAILYNICQKDAKSTARLAECARRIISASNATRTQQRLREFQRNRYRTDQKSEFRSKFKADQIKRMDGLLIELQQIVDYRDEGVGGGGYYNKRKKKSINEYDEFVYLDQLEELKLHFDRLDKIQEYYKLINSENDKFLASHKLPFISRPPEVKTRVDLLDSIIQTLNEFVDTQFVNDSSLSILSPRLFSIIPEQSLQRKQILSPTLLSFQQDGFFSLRDIFKIAVSNEVVQKTMLELILSMSGAGRSLDKIRQQLYPEIELTRNVHFPYVIEMSRHDYNWLKAQRTMSMRQKREMDSYGLTFLTRPQMELVYNITDGSAEDLKKTYRQNRFEQEESLDKYIQYLANLGPKQKYRRNRYKRDADDNNATSTETGDDPDSTYNGTGGWRDREEVETEVLRPYAFTNIIGTGYSMDAATLSPAAFFSEIMSTELGALITLSPQAFVASILSPSALTARTLSPTAFRAEVLSPRALTAWILSPEAFITEILTPRFLEPRILSPDAMVIDVLSPGILSPLIHSSEALGVIILSPNILSPRLWSEEKLLVEVLSPHILGGPHGKQDSSIISIRGGEHAEEHHAGDEGGAEHRGDIHIHREEEPEDAHGPSLQEFIDRRTAFG